jgi:thiol-disulfide isomerase/thioredoxin
METNMRSALLVMLALVTGCEAKPEPKPAPAPIIVIVKPRPPLNPIPAKNEPHVLDFYTTWCGPCRAAAPKIDQLEREGFKIARIDCDKDTVTADRYGIERYPTYVVIVNDKEVYRTHSADALRAFLTGKGRSRFPRM